MKSEPGDYSIDDLARDKSTWWTGVRNYQARNFMIKDMSIGDGVLFYHSSCKEPGIVGIAEVDREAQPDETQFDPKDSHYDPKATKEHPIWRCVRIRFIRKTRPMALPEIRKHKALTDMIILRRGNRLSITPITAKQWKFVESRI